MFDYEKAVKSDADKDEELCIEDRFANWVFEVLRSCIPLGLLNACCNQVREHVPGSVWIKGDLNKIPTFWVYVISIGTPGGFALVMLVLGYISFQSARTQTFISLDSTGDCTVVPRSVTGTYLASIGSSGLEGYWSSSPSFSFNTSAFRLTLTSFNGM